MSGSRLRAAPFYFMRDFEYALTIPRRDWQVDMGIPLGNGGYEAYNALDSRLRMVFGFMRVDIILCLRELHKVLTTAT